MPIQHPLGFKQHPLEDAGSFRDTQSRCPQLILAGARWHMAATSACASMGAMVVLRRTCRTACRAGRMQGAWKWTQFDGWFIQGGPLPHQFIQWSYGAPFFSRVKLNRYPIDFRPKADAHYIIEFLSPFITVV